MKYPVLSNEELVAQRGNLKPGQADFEVIAAKDDVSKKGNPMVKLTLSIWDSEGRQGQIFDYLVSNVQWKIKGFFDSIGNPEAYESGEIDADVIVGACGKVQLVMQKDISGKYGDQIKVRDYLKAGEIKESQKPTSDPASILGGEDDIPF